MSRDQFYALNFFIKHKPFRVLEADKNIGAVILSEELENFLALNSLDDATTYLKLDTNPLSSTQDSIVNILDSLVHSKKISKKCRNLLIVSAPKLGKFRILPKLHKEKFGIRPIINCIDSPTSQICLFVFLLLHPFVVCTESYLQDSQHLLQLLANIDVTTFKELYLYSCDFESLYTNIELELALNLVLEFANEKKVLDLEHINIEGFKQLLIIIFNNNIFKFKNNFFRQIRGLAMGSICGPVLANVVVYKLESKWLFIHKPLVYKRYIDDIFILSNTLIDLVVFKGTFGNLRLNIKIGQEVEFLDLRVIYDNIYSNIKTLLYIKPTNTFSYLQFNSNHKDSIFKNIPISLLIRVRRICSNSIEYFYFSRLFISQLVQRGYSYSYLFSIVRNIFKKNRLSLLPYKEKIDDDQFGKSKSNHFFVIPFNKSNISVNKIISNSFDTTKNIFNLDFKINVVNSVNNSLRKIFIHSGSLSLKNYNFKCSPCLLDKCKSCEFFVIKNLINFNKKFSLPVLSQCNCKSKDCIYIIHCIFCDCFYIGETMQTLEKRFECHLSNIRCFLPYVKEISEVAFHFNKKGHNIKEHLRIFLFASGISNEETRKNIESELIHLFLITGNKVINARLLRHIDRFCSCLV